MQIPQICYTAQCWISSQAPFVRRRYHDRNKMGINYPTWIAINGPLIILNLVTVAFYNFCMVCQPQGQRIKQPLRLLLGSLVFSTTVYVLGIFVVFFSELLNESHKFTSILLVVSGWSLSMSMTSSVWMNFFYYTQIVPAKCAFFSWIKKNIKKVIYSIWLLETVFSWLNLFCILSNAFHLGALEFNNTMAVESDSHKEWLSDMYITLVLLSEAYFFFCLCVMGMSNASTVIYLCRHMQSMAANGQSLSCPRFVSQVRVTITGILQGVLYTSYCLWLTYIYYTPFTPFSQYTYLTVLNLYVSVTTFNLGAGQAVFRQRASDIWTRASQWFSG